MLTDYRRKKNNVKLLDLLDVQFKEVDGLLRTIQAWRDVDKAEGDILDEIGREVGQLRKDSTDEVYRLLIKGKVLSNNSKGDIFSVTQVVSTVLGIEPGEFALSESYLEDINQVGNVVIEKVPIKVMLESGLTVKELVLLVKATLSAGIGLETLEVQGTFEYVDELVNDMDTGFADVDMTTGGTLGMVYEEKE